MAELTETMARAAVGKRGGEPVGGGMSGEAPAALGGAASRKGRGKSAAAPAGLEAGADRAFDAHALACRLEDLLTARVWPVRGCSEYVIGAEKEEAARLFGELMEHLSPWQKAGLLMAVSESASMLKRLGFCLGRRKAGFAWRTRWESPGYWEFTTM